MWRFIAGQKNDEHYNLHLWEQMYLNSDQNTQYEPLSFSWQERVNANNAYESFIKTIC